ncbi:alpha/beta fold hydrolase [Flavitalea sp.]|nr:alpha/beta hydrolase [Flavitalea sp.]
MNAQHQTVGHYAKVNELNMYYEIHGSGQPLVLLHGGGSTIQSTFGRILPELSKTHKVIAIELQAHGRTKDVDQSLSFEQDADDVAGLLNQLQVKKADIFGFSNGGTTTIQIAIRHPRLVNRIILASTLFQRSGMQTGFFEGMKQAKLEQMPAPLKEAYLLVNQDEEGLIKMFNRDVARMIAFKDIPASAIKEIQAPALVINGDAEVVLADHALLLSKTLSNARLAILPSAHGDYIGEICAQDKNSQQIAFVVALINHFLATGN